VSEKVFKNKLFQSKIETRYKKGKSAFTLTIYLGSYGILGRITKSIENSCKSKKITIFQLKISIRTDNFIKLDKPIFNFLYPKSASTKSAQ